MYLSESLRLITTTNKMDGYRRFESLSNINIPYNVVRKL